MHIRRIVTGHDQTGKSIFLKDSAASRTTEFKNVPGFATSLLWETSPDASVPATEGDPTVSARSWAPPPGGTNLMFITFPPDAVMQSPGFDPAAAGAEYMQVLPGLAERFEMDHPGMHTTDSVDYGVLIEGELHLELDDGATKKLAPRDVVIQNGTRHAWRNKSDKPATMLFVLVGAKRP
ncbi:cupin domain-containing protein [Variovorax sp. LjRoot84]|uniref:cupin domain-containing protein n=1 Tax=Variovorax sp. LjRoot84 TaxID=3342340 RepID=UPI003ECE6759